MGDLNFKGNKDHSKKEQLIVATPMFRREKIDDECQFIVVACDGIWEVHSSQEVCDYISEKIYDNKFDRATNAQNVKADTQMHGGLYSMLQDWTQAEDP